MSRDTVAKMSTSRVLTLYLHYCGYVLGGLNLQSK